MRKRKRFGVGKIILLAILLIAVLSAVRSRIESRRQPAAEKPVQIAAPAEERAESSVSEEALVEEEPTQAPDNLAIGVTPEFKEAMDSYEAFFDEYVEFMRVFSESEDTASMMAEYMDYMTKYTEVMQKFDEIGEREMSDADALYYAQVQMRISQKLMEASAS